MTANDCCGKSCEAGKKRGADHPFGRGSLFDRRVVLLTACLGRVVGLIVQVSLSIVSLVPDPMSRSCFLAVEVALLLVLLGVHCCTGSDV